MFSLGAATFLGGILEDLATSGSWALEMQNLSLSVGNIVVGWGLVVD